MEEKVIFEVDVTSLSKAVLQAQADLDMYNTALKDSIELNGKFSEETVQAKAAVDAQSKAVKQAEGSLVRLTQAEKALGGSLNDVIKNYDATNKSIDQNRKVLNALNAEYIKTVNPTKEFTARIKGISDELKRQEGAIGDTRRNVGNYAGDIVNAFGGGQFTGAIGNIGAVSKGILGIANSLGGFRTALLASGIGALAIAAAGLATYFRAFEDGSELLERKLSGLKGAADVVISQFGLMGKSIVDSIGESTKKSFADNAKSIGTSIKDGLLAQAIGVKDTYLALGKVISTFGKEGAAELQDAILRSVSFGTVSRKAIEDTADAASKAFKQAEEFTRQIQVLEENERTYGLTVSKNSIEVDRLRIAARNRSATFAEQIDLLTTAGALEKANLEIEKRNAEERLRIVKAQTDIKREQGTVTEKVTQAEYDAQIKLDNVKRNSIILNEKINNQISAVLDTRSALIAKENEAFNSVPLAAAAAQEELKKVQDSSEKDLRTHIQNQIALKQKEVEEEIRLEQIKLQAATSVSNSIIGLIRSVAEVSGANAEFMKSIAFVEVAVQSAIALATGIASSQDIPYPGNLIAMASTIIGVTAAIATAAVKLAASPDPPKPGFAGGVIGLNGAGTETSDSIPANLSKGESVMTAKATKVYHRQLAEMEWSVGNRPNYQFGKGRFAGGYIPIPNVSTDGGFTSREAMKSSDMNAMIKEAVRAGFSAAPSPKLSIVELESKQKSRNRSVKISELG